MRWLSILVVVLALVAAGCGGDDDSAASDDTTVEETLTEDTTTDEQTTTEETTDETDTDDLSGILADEDCLALAAAGASFAQAFTGATTAEQNNAFEELADKVPDEIQADVQVLAEAYASYAAEIEEIGIEPGATPTADQLQQLQAALASFDQQGVTEASNNLAAWAEENCPSG